MAGVDIGNIQIDVICALKSLEIIRVRLHTGKPEKFLKITTYRKLDTLIYYLFRSKCNFSDLKAFIAIFALKRNFSS